MKGKDNVKLTSIVLAMALSAALVAACTTGPAPRLVYKESQFNSRLEYIRFCQHHEMRTGRCD
jgi:hypothetical protein